MKRALLFFLFIVPGVFSYIYGQDTTNMTGSAGKLNMPAAQMTQMILDNENSIVNALKDKDMEKFGNYLADDFVGISGMGRTNKNEEIQSMKDVDIKNFSMSDPKVVFPTNDVAILTYKATSSGTYKGKDFNDTFNASTTWVKKDGKWLNVSHTEIRPQTDQSNQQMK
ncbi:MAG: nuclear transport factor 2 family protein [Clostridiales bacterium]